MPKSPMVPLTCRIPSDLSAAIDARAECDGKDRSDVVRTALAAYLGNTDSTETRLKALEHAVLELRKA